MGPGNKRSLISSLTCLYTCFRLLFLTFKLCYDATSKGSDETAHKYTHFYFFILFCPLPLRLMSNGTCGITSGTSLFAELFRECPVQYSHHQIPARSHTFEKIDHEITSTVILRMVVVSNKRKYVHELLVNRLFKLAQEKVWMVN